MAKYYLREEISHPGLNKYQVVSAPSRSELQRKVAAKQAQWDEQWRRKVAAEQRAAEREKRAQDAFSAVKVAEERTHDAEEAQSVLDSILASAGESEAFNFDDLKDFSSFSEPMPQKPHFQAEPAEPQYSDSRYHPKMSFGVKLSRKKKEAFEKASQDAFETEHKAWAEKCAEISMHNNELRSRYEADTERWQLAKHEFEHEQALRNADVDSMTEKYFAGDVEAVASFVEAVVNSLVFPIDFDQDPVAEFNPEDKSLVVDVYLPTIDDVPTLKSVSYVKSRQEFKESHYPASYLKKKYESVVYQIVLSIVHKIFSAGGDANQISSLVLNGLVRTIDKATGKQIEPYILSLSTTEEAFGEINLESVDPKTWFKSAKGVSATSIANVTPVAPIIQMSREDRRFIESYSVRGTLDDSVNLAAMDWQDFENLIRELFEQEFSTPGGEVKITQASRDGGVDAVAFDPDPVRGGKIVIQAKRYTSTVGVSAVRDLYGTVMNEGAMKGILVTTANFGNDAYKFANGKPLTLMNGANLLYLLEKHGHKAKIDLKEAKEIMSN